MARLRDSGIAAVVMLLGPAAAVIAFLHFADAPDWVWLAALAGLLGIALFAGAAGGEADGCGTEAEDDGRD